MDFLVSLLYIAFHKIHNFREIEENMKFKSKYNRRRDTSAPDQKIKPKKFVVNNRTVADFTRKVIISVIT